MDDSHLVPVFDLIAKPFEGSPYLRRPLRTHEQAQFDRQLRLAQRGDFTAWAVCVIKSIMAGGADEARARDICRAQDKQLRLLFDEGVNPIAAATLAVTRAGLRAAQFAASDALAGAR